MKKYVNPELELIVLQSADCITLSAIEDDSDPNKKDEVGFNEFWGA